MSSKTSMTGEPTLNLYEVEVLIEQEIQGGL